MKRTLWLFTVLLTVITVISTTIFFVSCNNKSEKKGAKDSTSVQISDSVTLTDTTGASNINKITSDRDNCIILTSTEISKWLQTGWDDLSSKNCIRDMMFNVISQNDPIAVRAYPSDRVGNRIEAKGVDCRIKTLNPPCTIDNYKATSNIIFQNFYTHFSAGGGRLIDFDYIRLRPGLYSNPEGAYPNHLTFEIEVIKNNNDNTETMRALGECKPSPPAVLKKMKDSTINKKQN